MKNKEGKTTTITTIDLQVQNLKGCTVLKDNLIIRISYGSKFKLAFHTL